MPTILYDNHLVSAEKLKEHSRLLHKIASGEIKAPQATKLYGVKYQGHEVAHARINKKKRIIYTHIIHKKEKTLFVLDVLDNHNYPQLTRKFKGRLTGSEPYIQEYQPKDEKLFSEAVESGLDNLDEKEIPLTYTAITSYNNMHLQFDDSQNKAVQLTTPAIILGPPGAGKTAVLFVLLLNFLKNLPKPILPKTAATAAPPPVATAAPISIASATTASAPRSAIQEAEILFVSPSNQLINNLKSTYEQTSDVAVRFSTWRVLLQSHYPDSALVTEQAFNEFFQKYFKAYDEPQKVHYELSLFAALDKEDYLKLGKRQSHFSGNKEQQDKIAILFKLWEKHLKKNKLIDPLFTMLPPTANKYITFCDETQNLPPTALRSLIQHSKGNHFVSCLDSEQCILTSPFIHNCLQQLLHKRFGTVNEHLLEQTWRCPPVVVKVANHLMNAKYDLDKETGNKRIYTSIQSSQDTQGLVSWVDKSNYTKLKPHGALPTTVVIAAKQPNDEERKLIENHLNCVNILTAEQAIGLDFSVVILWNPLSQGPLRPLTKKPKPGAKLTSEQWHGLNSLYVAITRAQDTLFICEERQTLRTQKLLGALPDNQIEVTIKETTLEDKNKQWEIQIQHHLDAGRFTLVSELMGQLGLSPEELKKRRGALEQKRTGGTPPLSQPTAQDFKWTPLPPNTLGQLKSHDEKERPWKAPKTKKSKAETTRKNQEKFNNYAIALLQTPTKERIKNLFADPKAKKYLLQYSLPAPYAKGSCLFKELIILCHNSKPEYEGVLPALAENLTAEIITSASPIPHLNNVLEIFTNSSPGQILLLRMLTHNPSLAKIINGSLLCQSNYFGNTPLANLSVNPLEGILILNKLLKNNPGFAQEITAEALCRSRPEEAGKEAYHSALAILTWSPEGRAILLELLNKNFALAKGITAKALLLALPKEAKLHPCKYPLYFLLDNNDGQFILQFLLSANPQLAKEITAEDICKPLPAEAEDSNYSPLYFLAEKPYLFTNLLALNPKLAHGITSEALCRAIPWRVGIGKCALFYLMSLPEGLKVLNILLDKTPNLAQQIQTNEFVQSFVNLMPSQCALKTDPLGYEAIKKIQQGGKHKLSDANQVQVVTLQPDLLASAAQAVFFPPASVQLPTTAASSGLDYKH